jgi:hypothetical protein
MHFLGVLDTLHTMAHTALHDTNFYCCVGLQDRMAAQGMQYGAAGHMHAKWCMQLFCMLPCWVALRHAAQKNMLWRPACFALLTGTLYADGHHIEQDSLMIQLFITLMKSNIDVGIVTAAGYPGDASKFENRIQGLLSAFKKYKLPASITNR